MPRITAELDMDAKAFFSGFDKAKAKSREAKASMERDWNGFGGLLGGAGKNMAGELEGLLAAGGLAGFAAGLKEIVDYYGEIADKAGALNETAESIQRTAQVAKEAGGSLEGVAGAVLKLEKNLGDLENTKAAAVLDKYGINAAKLMGLPLEEKIAMISDAFVKARESGTGLADLYDLLGKGSTELIPLLAQGGDALREAFAGVDVVTNDAVARLDNFGDKLDRFFGNVKAFAGQAIYSVIGLAQALQDYNTDDSRGVAFGTTLAERLSREDDEAAKKAAARKAAGQAIEEARAANEAAAAAKKKQEADDKAAKDKAAALKRIEDQQKRISRSSIDALPDEQKIPALQDSLQGVFEDMQKQGGMFFDKSIEGLAKWAEAAKKAGELPAAEKALGLLEEALSISKELDSVTEKLSKESAEAAKKMADAIKDLRNDTGKAGVDLLPPKERLAEYQRQLEAAIGNAVKNKGDVSQGLAKLKKAADDAHAAGDSEGEKAALEKLKTAQEAAKNMAGVEMPARQHVIGSLGGAINRILGRDPTELVAEEGRKTNQTLDRIERLMTQVERNTRQNSNQQPVGANFF